MAYKMVMEIAKKSEYIKHNSALDERETAKERLIIDLMNFFSQRPFDKFTSRKVAHKLKITNTSDIDEILKLLEKNGLVNKELSLKGLRFNYLYFLTATS